MVDVLVVLVLLLGALGAVLMLAKKRGWLSRFGVPVAPSAAPVDVLHVEQVLRVSQKSAIYVVRSGGQRVMILESNGAAQVIHPDSGREQL